MKHNALLQTRHNAPAETPRAAFTLALFHKCVSRALLLAISLLMLTPAGCGNDYNPRLINYLKAEKDLRSRITSEQGLNDSIAQLAKRFRIDADGEIARLKDNPRAWLELLNELGDKKGRGGKDSKDTLGVKRGAK